MCSSPSSYLSGVNTTTGRPGTVDTEDMEDVEEEEEAAPESRFAGKDIGEDRETSTRDKRDDDDDGDDGDESTDPVLTPLSPRCLVSPSCRPRCPGSLSIAAAAVHVLLTSKLTAVASSGGSLLGFGFGLASSGGSSVRCSVPVGVLSFVFLCEFPSVFVRALAPNTLGRSGGGGGGGQRERGESAECMGRRGGWER
jgi:hypothetical protein